MLLTLEDQILNMNHVSRVSIRSRGVETFVVVAEYAPPMYTPRTERESPRRREFTVDLHQGSEEECQLFIKTLATLWQSDLKIIPVQDIEDGN